MKVEVPDSSQCPILCAEIRFHVSRWCGEVTWLVVHNTELKVSDYATDTTLCIEEDRNSVIEILRTLTWFKHVSGRDINIEKTNVVKIGASRGRSKPWQVEFEFKWATSFEILEIYYDIENGVN